MDDIEDYGGHAEEVLSGLRDAVGSADEQLAKLQIELNLLERKTQEEGGSHQYLESHLQPSEPSMLDDDDDDDDDDISKYLDESTQETIDDSMLDSLQSSASQLTFRSSANILAHPNTAPTNCSTPITIPALVTKGSRTPSDEISTVKNTYADSVTVAENGDAAVEERWGCLKQVLSDRSASSAARNELFKQILHATEKRHQFPLKWEAKSFKPSQVTEQQAPTMQGSKDKSSFSIFQLPRGPGGEKLDDRKADRRRKNKFLTDDDHRSSDAHFFKPIRDEPIMPEHVQEDSSNILEETKAENQRLQLLLEEEKKKNDELTDKVSNLEKDVEELHIKVELKDHEAATGKISGIIEEIQMAQKVREKAMMERLHIAARDRDDALMRAKAIHFKIIQSEKPTFKDKGDKTLMDLVEKIGMADSARIIEKYGNELIQRMNNLKNARARITAEEMATVMTERDEAITKCHVLRQELENCVEELNNLKRTQHTSVNTTLKKKVFSTREECEQTRAKLLKAEEEIEKLRLHCSTQKSLTLARDQDPTEKQNEYVEKIKDEAKARAELAEVENFHLREKLDAAAQEILEINNENATIEHDIQQLKEKCGKLERLVKVLRKKLVNHAHGHSHRPIPAKS